MFPKPLLCVFSLLFCFEVSAQDRRLVVYDVATKQQTKFSSIDFDSTLKKSETDYFTGSYNESVINLSLEVPQENLHENTNFTNKVSAQQVANIKSFPFSTTIKLVLEDNGELFLKGL